MQRAGSRARRKRSSRNTRRVQRKFAVNLPRKNPPLRLSKFGVQSLRFFCDINSIDTVITDSAADPDFLDKLRKSGINVI